jgi:uncharacterized protein (DUF697 family)
MTPDEKANVAIGTMVGAVIGTSIIPAYVNWAITATAMGAGVVAIGLCYGVELTTDEAWHLVKQFIHAAGFWFMGMIVGTRILSMILTSTGIGYFGAVALDATVSGALAYAIGEASKAYFKGVTNKKVLGNVMRDKFKVHKARLDQQKREQSA